MSDEELVDIVDENMNFLRVALKRDAHVEGWLHKTVIAIVIDSKGRYLLTKPSASRQDPGQYVSPMGGHVSAGEADADALKREMYEEVGMKDFEDEFVGRAIYNREVIGRKENHFFIMYKVFSDEKPVFNHEHEAEGYHYFTEEELKNELKENPENFGGAFHFVVDNFFQNLI